MDEEWDAENFEPKEIATAASVGANKWEGEDEDEDVKDNWEDEEEEEKKDVEKQETKPVAQPKKSKKLLEKIEEKEQKQREEAERKAREKEAKQDMTVEEMFAEKVIQQKLQEESDLQVAMETFGVGETSSLTGIDSMNPNTKEEFDEFQEALIKKIQQFTKSQHFSTFAEDLIRNICVNLASPDLKKLKTTVENMFLEKSKVEKGDKAKKSKGKGKLSKLRVEKGENDLVNEYSAYADYHDEFDDFM